VSRAEQLIDEALDLSRDYQDVVDIAGIRVFAAMATAVVELAAALREPRAGLPTVPADAATVALGELPELRDHQIYVSPVALLCDADGCPLGGNLELPVGRRKVRDLIQAIAAHRRQYHLPA